MHAVCEETCSLGEQLLDDLVASSLVLAEDLDALPAAVRSQLGRCTDWSDLLPLLVEHGLLTDYQAQRISAGKTFGLVFGNYRVLNRLGAGGMGVVFEAEHVRMRRRVAIKVLRFSRDEDPRLLHRFLIEMRSVAQLQHPNIVGAIDAGELASPDCEGPVLHYFVMEYVQGRDLDDLVKNDGPLPAARACDLAYQIAGALEEAHRHRLVHRDIKPSNILIMADNQAKLLDFGLARNFRTRMTEPGTVLGTIEFMAPEQAHDASAVDIRADIYGLGGTLFWCLTGRLPFVPQGNIVQEITMRLTQEPPSARIWRPEVPVELDAVVRRMMATKADDRYATPQLVMRALLPFLQADGRLSLAPTTSLGLLPARAAESEGRATHEVLVVDDEPSMRTLCTLALQSEAIRCEAVANGRLALEALRSGQYDLMLLDIHMPEMSGKEVLRLVREQPPCPNFKVIMFSGGTNSDDLAQLLLTGADDYLTKPFSVQQLQARVKTALRLKDAQDRSNLLNRHLVAVNSELEGTLLSRDSDLIHARNALVLALAKLVERRDVETGAHLMRLQRFCRVLTEAAAATPAFADQIDQPFMQMLECCVPLHDIGKVGLPDHILLKPGQLTPDERLLMQTHTIMGAETLAEVARQHPFARAFLQMAIDIARHHHERWDGTGYPDRIAGTNIPLAARLVAFADVYDALRSRRIYKPSLAHSVAMSMMLAAKGQFDPALVPVFQSVAGEFEKVYRDLAD